MADDYNMNLYPLELGCQIHPGPQAESGAPCGLDPWGCIWAVLSLEACSYMESYQYSADPGICNGVGLQLDNSTELGAHSSMGPLSASASHHCTLLMDIGPWLHAAQMCIYPTACLWSHAAACPWHCQLAAVVHRWAVAQRCLREKNTYHMLLLFICISGMPAGPIL